MPVIDLEKNSTYVVDRVLTPSIFRVRAKTGCHGREFGTQTDIHYGKYSTEDAESTERLNVFYCLKNVFYCQKRVNGIIFYS